MEGAADSLLSSGGSIEWAPQPVWLVVWEIKMGRTADQAPWTDRATISALQMDRALTVIDAQASLPAGM